MKTLCILVTGKDVVTAENCATAFPLLVPFIQRVEIACKSLEEANQIRAKLGKAPLGKHSLPTDAQSPQGD